MNQSIQYDYNKTQPCKYVSKNKEFTFRNSPFQIQRSGPFLRCVVCSVCDFAATPCGENIYYGSSKVPWSFAIMRWYNEVKDYSYDLRRSFNNKVVGHYTQVDSRHAHGGGLKLNWSVQQLGGNKMEWAPDPVLSSSGCLAQFKRDWLWNGPLPQV